MMDVDGDAAPSLAGIKEDGDTSTKKQLPKDQDFYFNFYSSLQNQANMIGDISRTGTYRKAILGNAAIAIQDKRVLDVGAGSGVLSFMAAQAGAKEVIALEASSMAEKISVLVKQANEGVVNPHIKDKVRVVRGLVEDEDTQKEVLQSGKVDTIISEPIGVMLLHERMVESFLLARDMFLKPGGQLLPSGGHLFFCPFSDEGLYNETDQKAQFFNATLFGTDFRGLYSLARQEVFAQPVVGMFPVNSLLAAPCPPKSFDFHTCHKEDIVNFSVPIEFIVSRTALIHGLASWFDLDFFPNPATFSPGPPEDQELLDQWEYNVNPPATWPWLSVDTPLNPGPTPPPPRQGLDVKLSTGPHANKGERVVGSVRFTANDARSYDLLLELTVDRPGSCAETQTNPNPLSRKAEFNLSQQCFNYSYNPDTLTTASAGMGYTA